MNSLTKNSLYNIGYKTFSILFPILSQSYLARVITTDQIGLIAFANNIVSYFTFLAPLGITRYGVRQISNCRDNPAQLKKVFTELFIINASSSLFFTAAYFLLIFFCPYFHENSLLHYVFGLNILFNLFNVDWFFVGVERFDFIAKRSILIKTLSFIVLILVVRSPKDYFYYALISIFALCGNYFISFVASKNFFSFSHGLEYTQHFQPLIVLLASAVASELYIMFDSTMIRIEKGDTELAYYSYSTKILRISFAVISAIFATFFPRLSNFWSKSKEQYSDLLTYEIKLAFFICVPCSLFLFFCSKEIILILFGKNYFNSIITLRVLSPLLIVFTFAYVLGHIPLLIYRLEKKILFCTVCASLLNLTLNFILIPLYGRNGAAIASFLAECSITVLLLMFSFRFFRFSLSIESLSKTLISSAILLLFFLIFPFSNLANIISISIKIVIGSIFFLLSSFFLKNSVLLYILSSSICQRILGCFTSFCHRH